MAGSAASESILFVGAIIIAVAFVGVMTGVVQNLSGGVREQGGRLAEGLESDITIINDPGAVPSSPLVLYVKNTGARVLYASLTDVLVNGEVHTPLDFDILGSDDDETWRPGQVLKITVTGLNLAGGDHRVRVVAHNGVEDSMRFHV